MIAYFGVYTTRI